MISYIPKSGEFKHHIMVFMFLNIWLEFFEENFYLQP